MTASHDGTVRLWKSTDLELVPSWLADLAEALAGKWADGRGGHLAGSYGQLAALRQRAATIRGDTPENRWFLIERLQHSKLSPQHRPTRLGARCRG